MTSSTDRILEALDETPASGRQNGTAPAEPLRTRQIDFARVRPVRWTWQRRFPRGYLSLIVGEEAVGKGTLVAWVAARRTTGELPGDDEGDAGTVLIVGDEDSFEPVWVPRLYAAGADLERVLTLGDGEYLDDFKRAADRLQQSIERDRIDLVIFDQLLDHVPGGSGGEAVYNPKHIREALTPLRRVAAACDVPVVGLLHPIKGNPRTFREILAGSHQFNAVSRSSLWLGRDPDGEEHDRVLVRGKGNLSAAPRSFEFRIAAETVELGGHVFDVPKIVDPVEGDRTIDDLLKPAAAPVRAELEERILALLNETPKSRADLARALERDPKDGSVGNALKALSERGIAVQVAGGPEKGWKRR